MISGMGDVERRKLSPSVRIIWGWKGIALILLVAFVVNYFSSSFSEIAFIKAGEMPLFVSGGALLALALYIGYLELEYNNYYYALTENELVIRHGVLKTESVVIPYVKIQNICVSRGIIQRIFGSAKLMLETAGRGSPDAEGVIPCVGNYKKVIEDIMERRNEAIRKGSEDRI